MLNFIDNTDRMATVSKYYKDYIPDTIRNYPEYDVLAMYEMFDYGVDAFPAEITYSADVTAEDDIKMVSVGTTDELECKVDNDGYVTFTVKQSGEYALLRRKPVVFTDVLNPDEFYYNYVYDMAGRGIVQGYNDSTFRPYNDCNRAAVVTFLWRLMDKPEPAGTSKFSDPTGTEDFDKAISWVAENGITTGWDDNTFRPWVTCNRAAVVTFLWRAAGKPEPQEVATFSDMTGNGDFDKAISWAAENGITTGWDDNTFRPWRTCNRLAIVSFLARYEALNSK